MSVLVRLLQKTTWRREAYGVIQPEPHSLECRVLVGNAAVTTHKKTLDGPYETAVKTYLTVYFPKGLWGKAKEWHSNKTGHSGWLVEPWWMSYPKLYRYLTVSNVDVKWWYTDSDMADMADTWASKQRIKREGITFDE